MPGEAACLQRWLALMQQLPCTAGSSARWPCPPQANEFKPSARDLELEAGRKKMRDVFDVDRWVVHRSQSRYFRHLLALPQ